MAKKDDAAQETQGQAPEQAQSVQEYPVQEYPVQEPTGPVAPAPPSLEDRKAALLAYAHERLARAGLGEGVVIEVVAVDPDERGATVSVEDADLTGARFGVMTLLAAEDGREWTWRGSGPNVANGRFRAFVHVASF